MENNILIAQKLDAFNCSVLNEEINIPAIFMLPDSLRSRIPVYIRDIRINDETKALLREDNMNICLSIAFSTWKTAGSSEDYASIFENQSENGNAFIDASDNLITSELVEKFYMEEAETGERSGNSELEQFLRSSLNSPVKYYDINHRDGIQLSCFADCAEYLTTLTAQMYPLYPEQLKLPQELYDTGVFVKWTKAAINLDESVFGDKSPRETFASLWTENGEIANEDCNDLPAVSKRELDAYIAGKIKQDGRVSFSEIMDFLKKPPYGLVGSRLSAYYVALLLRSYMSEDYYWSDGLISGPMNADYLRTSIVNQIKSFYRKIPSRREDCIVAKNSATVRFIELSREIWGIDEDVQTIEQLRILIRYKLSELPYPLWAAGRASGDDAMQSVADGYIRLARSDFNSGQSDFATAGEITGILDGSDELKQQFIGLLHSDELEAEWKETLEKIGRSPVTSEWKWIWDEETVLLLR